MYLSTALIVSVNSDPEKKGKKSKRKEGRRKGKVKRGEQVL